VQLPPVDENIKLTVLVSAINNIQRLIFQSEASKRKKKERVAAKKLFLSDNLWRREEQIPAAPQNLFNAL
jgi:hypothetical protein